MVSVITINLNNKEGLIKTIESVLSQTCIKFEFIVIDGNSNDGSTNVLRNYSDKLTYWISEPDTGIYNAMNKGISKSRGDYCLFLNSGDYFLSTDSLGTLIREAAEVDLIYGDLLVVDNNRSYVRKSPDQLTFDYFYIGESLPHAATLIKRSLFDSFGLYNEHFKFVSDWEFFLKGLVDGQMSYKHINEVIIVFDGHGISARQANIDTMKKERDVVFESYSFFIPDYQLLNQQKKKLTEIEISQLHRFADRINRSSFWTWAKKIKRFIKLFA